jgi:hypothetical protein
MTVNWIWGGCIIALSSVALSIYADRKRSNRSQPDAVGFMPWPLILIISMLLAAVFAAIGLKS